MITAPCPVRLEISRQTSGCGAALQADPSLDKHEHSALETWTMVHALTAARGAYDLQEVAAAPKEALARLLLHLRPSQQLGQPSNAGQAHIHVTLHRQVALLGCFKAAIDPCHLLVARLCQLL